MDAVASVRFRRTVRFGDGPTTPSGVGGESPLLPFMTLGLRTSFAIHGLGHDGHDLEVIPYWLGDLQTIDGLHLRCSCGDNTYLDITGEEVKNGEVLQ